jgi:hypothetical protein
VCRKTARELAAKLSLVSLTAATLLPRRKILYCEMMFTYDYVTQVVQ